MRNPVLIVLLMWWGIGTSSAAELTREHINPEGLYDHPAYTHLVTVEGDRKTLYVAGQIAVDENFECVGRDDWRAQYLKVMDNLKIALAAGGATYADITYIRRFVTDMKAYFKMLREEANPVPDYFDGRPPASTLIGVTALADDCFLLEIDAIAVVPAG